jgi:membrane protease YdiL (CAAX protease family)
MTFTMQAQATSGERFKRLEDAGRDFPYYNDAPTTITTAQWLLVLVAVVVAFLLLALPIDWPGDAIGPWIPALLFPGLPLAALAFVAGKHWTAIFGKVGFREVRLMIGFALLNIVVSMAIGFAVKAITDVAPNAANAILAGMGTGERAGFFAKMIPQLLGEEVITLLPFLALLQWSTRNLGMGRKAAIIGAWLVSSLVFGLIHLPTYDWNFVQCIVIIGSARLVLTLPWILTKNIWVSTGAHVINDWLLLGMGLLGAGLVANT